MEDRNRDYWTQNQLDDNAIKTAQDSLILAGSQNQELSKESRSLYDVFYDKLLLYSAGAFSFSVALVGLVVGDRINALAKVGFLIPNIYWLYFSLILYLITCAGVLIARRFDAIYVANFGMSLFCEKKKAEQVVLLAKLKNFPGEILVTQGGTREQAIEQCKQNIFKIGRAEKENAARRDRAYSIKVFCHRIGEITVILATLLLLLFTIQMVQAMIWG